MYSCSYYSITLKQLFDSASVSGSICFLLGRGRITAPQTAHCRHRAANILKNATVRQFRKYVTFLYFCYGSGTGSIKKIIWILSPVYCTDYYTVI